MMTSNKKMLIIKLIYVMFFLAAFYFVFTAESKKELHLMFNKYNSNFFDLFFKYTTHLGDGIMFGVLIVLFFFIDKMKSLTIAISGILTLLFTHLFKKIVFKGIPRPVELIGEAKLHLIEGVKIAHWNSFPSGHTTTAFAIATVLIYVTKNKFVQVLYLVLAILAGLSRVYLSQHFLQDILAGSALGILVGMISLRIVQFIKSRREVSL